MFGFKVFIRNEYSSSFIEKYELPTGKVVEIPEGENAMIDLEPIKSFIGQNFERYVNRELVAISILHRVAEVPVVIEKEDGSLKYVDTEHVLSLFYDDITEE